MPSKGGALSSYFTLQCACLLCSRIANDAVQPQLKMRLRAGLQGCERARTQGTTAPARPPPFQS